LLLKGLQVPTSLLDGITTFISIHSIFGRPLITHNLERPIVAVNSVAHGELCEIAERIGFSSSAQTVDILGVEVAVRAIPRIRMTP